MRTKNHKIPKEALAPLAAATWKSEEGDRKQFDYFMEMHKKADMRDGNTARYWYHPHTQNGPLTYDEAKALAGTETELVRVKEDGSISVNQHYQHSLEQFYAVCQDEWNKHIERTERLKGTCHGR